MDDSLAAIVDEFLTTPVPGVGTICNEHALQLELGIYLRNRGYTVEFEKPFRFKTAIFETTKPPKRELDILVAREGRRIAIELKTPLAGRVPETMFDFIADIDFVERLVEDGFADGGMCLLVTSNRQFWTGHSIGIYQHFRSAEGTLKGSVTKPTGLKDSVISLRGSYVLGNAWKKLGNTALMVDARYLLVAIEPTIVHAGPASHPTR